MTHHRTPNTIAEMVACLDALAAATRDGDITAYRAALADAETRGATTEQIRDAWRWGERGARVLKFDYRGEPIGG